MSTDKDKEILQDIISRRGRDFIQNELGISVDGNILTIVSNYGVHPVPEEFVFGDIYYASSGNLDFSNIKSVNDELDKIIVNLKRKLNEKRWSKIYLIPFGHSVISMNIKMAVYRVLRIETIDIFYFGSGVYGQIVRDMRSLLVE